ncbi:MAG: hypothetical protein K9K39_05570 [Desulfohalobiaceae bacterium]|nr:hypothetical protein [Desulfohalobiaceae bacterium]
MKKVAVVIREPRQQYEGLRTSLGALMENLHVQMIVLENAIQNMDEAYYENMMFLDEMEGERYSDHPENIDKHGFDPVSMEEVGDMLKQADIVIPF